MERVKRVLYETSRAIGSNREEECGCKKLLPVSRSFGYQQSIKQVSINLKNQSINQSITLFTHRIISLKSGLLKSRAH